MLRPPTPLAVRLLLALPLALVAACDGSTVGAQQAFEDEALLSPVSGITRTDANGRVEARDPSDWRIAPAYVNRVEFIGTPFPNPVRYGQDVSVPVNTAGVPGGLRLVLLEEDPQTGSLDLVALRDPRSECPGGAGPDNCLFYVSASQIGLSGPGLYRLVLLDGVNGIVSYGDVEVRP